MANKKITIERTTDQGYESNEYTLEDALTLLNNELESKRTLFIDGQPFFGEFIQAEDIAKCKREISVTNQLIGG